MHPGHQVSRGMLDGRRGLYSERQEDKLLPPIPRKEGENAILLLTSVQSPGYYLHRTLLCWLLFCLYNIISFNPQENLWGVGILMLILQMNKLRHTKVKYFINTVSSDREILVFLTPKLMLFNWHYTNPGFHVWTFSHVQINSRFLIGLTCK